jgi:hypothetical protein
MQNILLIATLMACGITFSLAAAVVWLGCQSGVNTVRSVIRPSRMNAHMRAMDKRDAS